jgi:hypothetical protein
MEALYQAALLDSSLLDGETVTQLAYLTVKGPHGRDMFNRLFNTRAAVPHPLNAQFLDSVLREMGVPDRDLRWTEWIRRREEFIISDLERLAQRWKRGVTKGEADFRRAQWVMWTLTSTVRILRDRATYALYWYGTHEPELLFKLTVDALKVNDLYVPERMLAACYGVGMGLWAAPNGDKLRAVLPSMCNTLVNKMFIPGAPHSTPHALARGYALGIISLAEKVQPGCIPTDKRQYLSPPFDHLLSPFSPPENITDDEITRAQDAMHMDFENYTLGGLIRNRRNYDFDNPDYKTVRRQIEHRIVELGYGPERFAATDKLLAQAGWRAESAGRSKIDRYGKKYSWIAYFEMYGLRADRGLISEWHDRKRPSEADIDPSFPEPARKWLPSLPEIFTASAAEPRAWVRDGPAPDYRALLNPAEVDDERGPWVVLEGYIEQSSTSDRRHIFSFLRGILVKEEDVETVLKTFNAIEYPGNSAIPEPSKCYYTYAGEIPWSEHFAEHLRESNGSAKRDEQAAFAIHDGTRWLPGVSVELPAYNFAWESYHSPLNQAGGATLLAPALSESLRLSNRQAQWDLYDPSGRLATIYRRFKKDEDQFRSDLLYLRSDLMRDYLATTAQRLVWLVWGERNFTRMGDFRGQEEFYDLFRDHSHIHRFSAEWQPEP